MKEKGLTYQETKHLCGTHLGGLSGVNPGQAGKIPSTATTLLQTRSHRLELAGVLRTARPECRDMKRDRL